MTLQEIEKMQADEKGIIVIDDNGRPRRFVKDKLIACLASDKSGKVQLPVTSVQKPKNGRPKTNNPKPVKNAKGAHKKKPVIAILPCGETKQYPSAKEAAGDLKMHASNISNIIKGNYEKIKGIRFRFAEADAMVSI